MTTRQMAQELLDKLDEALTPFPERRRVSSGSPQYGLSITSGAVIHLMPPDDATEADIYVRTASVVFTRTGTDPTATKGFQADPADIIRLVSREELTTLGVIAVSATATLDVEYFNRV